jgi:hypothetical protein
MRWLVEITDIIGDERLLADLLETLEITLYLEENRTYLTGNPFESLSTSTEVWEEAKRIFEVVSEVTGDLLGQIIRCKIGYLYEQHEDGSRGSYVFCSMSLAVATPSVCGVVVVTSTSEISEEERTKLEAERLEREYQEKLDRVSPRIKSAYLDGRALKVHRFLQQELTPVSMYHIYELIRDDVGEKLNSLASQKEWTRFTRSVNHQKVFGDAARHMTSKKEPPAKPMSLEEARSFILRAADLWFKQKASDNSA